MTLPTPAELAAMIDHAALKPTQGDADLEAACALAHRVRLATVCVKPYYVARAARLLDGSGTGAATVLGFPHGGQPASTKVSEAIQALRDGAVELDMVINIGALVGGDLGAVRREVEAVVGVAHARGALVKVILECAYLNDAQKTSGAKIAEDAGADFVKTSTGFAPTGATVADVRLLRATVAPRVGVKASGGMRTLDEALAMVGAGASRLGMSSTDAVLDELRKRLGSG